MAEYSTVAQSVELYGEDYIAVACDRDNDGAVDTASFEKHLRVASREMSSYLLGRYSLPLASPPEHMQKVCTDIAVYNGCPTADVLTKIMSDRHEAAIKWCMDVAKGVIKLEVAADTTTNNAAQTPQVIPRSEIRITSTDRVFNRDRLKNLM